MKRKIDPLPPANDYGLKTVTMRLYTRELARVDAIASAIRGAYGRGNNRSEALRALINAGLEVLEPKFKPKGTKK